jgi:hypothetical protein
MRIAQLSAQHFSILARTPGINPQPADGSCISASSHSHKENNNKQGVLFLQVGQGQHAGSCRACKLAHAAQDNREDDTGQVQGVSGRVQVTQKIHVPVHEQQQSRNS